MRKDTLNKATSAAIKTVGAYHGHDYYGEAYAFQGFSENRYFTSDRYIQLDENFNRKDGKPLKGYGLEIEVECDSISNSDILCEVFDKVIASHFPAGLYKYQRDGSLEGESSLEAITQVMTKEFIRNHYPEFKIMFNSYFSALGISASYSGNCGMHVNISNGNFGTTEATQDEAVRKLYYIINKHYDFFVQAFARNPRCTGYCSRMDYSKAKTMDLHNMSSSHGNCLNYSHYDVGRIEIRLVGGQSSFGCFRNTMETVFHLVDRVKKISWSDCDSLVKIFEGCNYHVLDRISTNCYQAGAINLEEVEQIKAKANLIERYI